MSFKIDVKDFPPEVGSWEVPIECPNCKAQNKVSLSQIKREETIKCVSCGMNIKLQDKDKSVQKGTDEVQKALDDLERTLRDFGAEFR
jgi:predicted Zn finger-like uncharacterized protein